MAVGFGFSVGDLFTSLKLIKDSIEAVKDSKGASADYAALITEIDCLRDGFEAIGSLQLDRKSSEKQKTAINRAIRACQNCIDDFLMSISKYQAHLHTNTSGLASNYRKIKWVLCRKDDVAAFRAQLERHTSTINMLLITFQARELVASRDGENTTDLVSIGREDNENCPTLNFLKGLSGEQRQCFEFLMYQNKELMRNVQDLNRMLRIQMTIPPQVLLQQPVILLDAFGKIAPFHLDFINSLETFTAVLKIRFRQAGVKQAGLSKLENQEFIIQETRRKKVLELSRPWPSVFQPGQEVDMSMVFHRFACPSSTCPGCSNINEGDEEQTQCPKCGLCYQNIQATTKSSDLEDPHPFHPKKPMDFPGKGFQYVIQRPGMKPETKIFSPTADPEDENFDSYRRVQVISQPFTLFQRNQYPPKQLESFNHFIRLFDSSKGNTLPFLNEMRRIRSRINQHILHTRKMPAFSSFSRIKQWQKEIAEESSVLGKDVEKLFDTMRSNDESNKLVEHLARNSRPSIVPGYYATLLANSLKANKIFGADNEAGTANVSNVFDGSPQRPRSKEQVQWMLLDSRRR